MCSPNNTTNCNAVDGGALRRHIRLSESIDKFPNCRCHKRSSGDRPQQSDHDGGEPVHTNSRTVIKVLSMQDVVIKSGSEPDGGRSAVNSSR